MVSTSSKAPPSSPPETPTINNSTESKPLENADPKGKKPLENNHYNAASSSEITNEDDNHGGALSHSSEAQLSLSKSMGVSTSGESPPSSPTKTPTINKSSTKTKSKYSIRKKFQCRAGTTWFPLGHPSRPFHFLTVQIWREKVFGGEERGCFNPSHPKVYRTARIRRAGATWTIPARHRSVSHSIRSLVADSKAKFFVTKPKPLENNPHNAASSSGITNEDDNHGGALSHSSEMIQKDPSEMIQMDLLLLDWALMEFMRHTSEKINEARERFEKLLKLPSSGTDHFDVVRRAIRKLEDQISSLENNHHNAASSSGTTKEDDNHGGAHSLSSEMIHKDLLLLNSALMKYMHHTYKKINQAIEKFKELLKLPSSGTDHFDEVRRAIRKLKDQIPSHRSSYSKPQREWPNINMAKEGLRHFFYKEPEDDEPEDEEPEVKQTGDMEEAFRALSEPLRCCLLCFFKFPRDAFIRITTMIYLWIGQGYVSLHLQNREEYPQEREELPLEENAGKKIFDELIAKNFIERCSSVPNSCRMRLSVRSSLYKEAERMGFTSNVALDLDRGSDCGGPNGRLCLINVGKAIIKNKLEFFDNMMDIRSLHLGRWQNSAKHHIELEDIKFLDGLGKLKRLTFLSLRGIFFIKELPTSILELNDLKILDLRACQNLEVIPKNIGLLKNLTHLDMSECCFLEHMPESLVQLSNLEVLKGFFIGHLKEKQKSCTLYDLTKLPKLKKLNIYTGVKKFPTGSDLEALQNFKGLLKLTISWGGCYSKHEKNDGMTTDSRGGGLQTLHLRLQKLDLQGFPMKSLPHWLRPANLKELKKLYIRGGNLCNLGQLPELPGEQYWNVEKLRLKYLSELVIDWSQLRLLFPELIYLHQLECPKLTSFPVDESGVWIDKEATDAVFWLQKFFKSDGISLSSLLGYDSNLALG